MQDAVRLLEDAAGRLHALAFDIGEHGVTDAAQAEAGRIVDAVLGIVHEQRN